METIVLPEHKISRSIQLTGFLFFGALFYICWRFYLERMLSFDGAFYVFRFMESGKFNCSPGRYGDYVAEAFALFAFKMNCSLSTILRTYSVAFIVLHYLIFLFVTLKLKHNGAGIAMMLASCLAYYYAFYLPTMELHESLVLGVLLWAIIHPEYPYYSTRQKNMATIGAIITIFCMSFFHPLGIFIIAFVLGIEFFGAKRYMDKQLWIIVLLGLGWYLLKFYVISKQQYDQDQVVSFHSMFSNLSGWQTWPSSHYVSELTKFHFRTLKWLAIICLLFSLRKGLLTFLFFLLFIAGYTFIFLANFRSGAAPIAYESYYLIYGFIIGLMFVFLFYHPRRRNLVLFISLFLLWTSVKKIYYAHSFYSNRLAYIGRLVKQAHNNGEKKCFVDSKCYPYDYALSPWNVAFETLLYSSLPGSDSSVSIFIREPALDRICDSTRSMNNVLFGVYFSPLWFTSNDMPDGYFRLPSTGYKYLTHSQEDTSFHEEIYSAQNIKIVPKCQIFYAHVNDYITAIPVEIINTSGHSIPAIPRSKHPVLVGFKLFDEHGREVYENLRSTLETDVTNNSGSGLIMYIPKWKGTYYAIPEINTEGIRKWKIPVRPIKVILD